MTRTHCCSRECKGLSGGAGCLLVSPPRLLVYGAVRRVSPVRVPRVFLPRVWFLVCACVSVLGVPRYLRGNASFVDRKEESV